MSKRLIGIEIGPSILRVAILNQEKGQLSVVSLQERGFAAPDEMNALLKELLSGEFKIGDQLVTSLPATNSLRTAAGIPLSGRQENRRCDSFHPGGSTSGRH